MFDCFKYLILPWPSGSITLVDSKQSGGKQKRKAEKEELKEGKRRDWMQDFV